MLNFSIRIPGGIVPIGFLRKLCLELNSLSIEKVYIGRRQNLFFYLKDNREVHKKRLESFLTSNQIFLKTGEFNIIFDSYLENEFSWFKVNEFYETIRKLPKLNLKISFLEKEDDYNLFLSDINIIPSINPNEFYLYLFYKNHLYFITKPKNFFELKVFLYKIEENSHYEISNLLESENYLEYKNYFEYRKEKSDSQIQKLQKKLSNTILLFSRNNSFEILKLEEFCYELKKIGLGYIYISPYTYIEIYYEREEIKNLIERTISKIFDQENYYTISNENKKNFPNLLIRFDEYSENCETLIQEIRNSIHPKNLQIIDIQKEMNCFHSIFNIYIQKPIFRRGKKYDLIIHPFVQKKIYENLNLNQLIKNLKNVILLKEEYDFIPHENIENWSFKDFKKKTMKQCIKCYSILQPEEIHCYVCKGEEFIFVSSPSEEMEKKLKMNTTYKNL